MGVLDVYLKDLDNLQLNEEWIQTLEGSVECLDKVELDVKHQEMIEIDEKYL